MERMIADSRKVNESGEMKPCRAAKNDPAKPANIAPMAKAVSLVLVVLMPRERQAISSSRNASQARPTGRRRRRTVANDGRRGSAGIREDRKMGRENGENFSTNKGRKPCPSEFK